MVYHIKKEFYIGKKRGKDVIIWIPSHIGISGNEKADRCTRNAITDESVVPISKVVNSELKCVLNKKTSSLWQSQWTETS